MSTSPPRSEPPRYRARRASRGWRPCSFALNRASRADRRDRSWARAPRGRGRRLPSDRRSCTHSSGRTTVTSPRRRRRASRRGRRPAGRREGTGAYEKGTRKPEGSRRYTTPGGGACRHLVRASRIRCVGAPNHRLREPGPRCHCSSPGAAIVFVLRHPAIEPGDTWGVGHGLGNGHPLRGGSRREIPFLVTSRVTGLRPTGLVTVGAAALIRIHQRHGRPPISEGDLAFQALREAFLSLTGCARRTTPRRSRSRWTTRAAFTRSGSWFTVPATQSM